MIEKPIHKEFEKTVDKRYQLENLINMDDLRKLLDDFHKIAPFPLSVLNLKGDVLLESHWGPICTRFHRVNPKTAAICVESDTHFNAELAKGDEKHKLYRCQNGLDNAASPIMIEGQHLGNFYLGQFLLEPPNEGFFRKQAQRYGFEEEAYLEALSRVPIMSEHDLKNRLDYLCGLAEFLGNIGLKELQRDRAKEALRESEERFSLFMDHLPAVAFIKGEEGRTQYVNKYMNDVLGAKDWIGKTTLDLFPKDIAEPMIADDKKTLAEGYRMIVETVPDRHGTDHIYQTHKFKIERSGKPPLLGGIALDITDRVQAEEALWESEKRFRRLIENAKDTIYRMSLPDGTYDYVSPAVTEMIGYTPEEFTNSPLLVQEYIHPDSHEYFKEQWELLLVGKIPRSYEYQIVHGKSGETRWINQSNVLVRDDEGQPIAIEGIASDITERKRAEEALRESEQRFREMADLLPNTICEMDLNLKLTYVNNFGLETFGYTQDEFDTGVNGMDIIHPEDREKAATNMEQIANGVEVGLIEYRMIKKDGSELVALVNSSPIHKDGQISGFRCSVTDISKQKLMQEELLKAKKLESLGVLAGGIAHDFNNLMSAVVGNISLARTEMRPGSKGFKNLVEAEKASIQTKALTTRLITFSEGGKPMKEIVSIGHLVKDSVDSSLKGSDMDVRFSIPDDISPVEIDEDQMKQALYNIVTNAQEAMTGQGTISVSCENADIGEKDTLTLRKGKYVKISIEDQGRGIPEEDLVNIFDPYFSTKEMGTQKGMGLGLSISDSIVKQHDGLITVESQLGAGTLFSIYLPASEKEIVEAAPVKKSVPEKYVSQGENILVMDDEEVVRDVSNALLTHIGYKVEVAVEGIEAIEMYKQAMESEKPFDVVILDLTNKVGMGGVETIVRLLEIDPDVKAIVATGYSNDPIISKFREHGFCGALPKPFTLDQLRTALHDAIVGE